jgi:geranylgeranyl reductase family protein
VVVGAGPAGSTTACRLACEGASVLLLDRARFPRDKPCGGAVTGRALRLLPFSIDPVVETMPDRFELRLRYGARFEGCMKSPIASITQRRRLDAYLVEQAVSVGATFEDGVRVAGAEQDEGGVVIDLGGRSVRARALIVAEGANGTTGRSLGLTPPKLLNVALEGNLPYDVIGATPDRGTFTIEVGVVPGGYAWFVPKGDHYNLGVGGWESEGPHLRDHLRRLCEEHGVPFDALTGLRGHRLPMGGIKAGAVASGRVLAVGDAAGLVDPFSGDGMYEAFLSSSLAAKATLDLLAGRAPDLLAYDAAVRRRLGRAFDWSWLAKLGLDRFPRLSFALMRSGIGQTLAERALRGERLLSGLAS